MSLGTYTIRRLLYIFPTLLGISAMSFALIAASPGDPIRIRIGLFLGEQTDYDAEYDRIGLEIGLLQKVGQDSVTFSIDMSETNGFSLKTFNVSGVSTPYIEYPQVTLRLSSDIARVFTIPSYNITVNVPAGSETVETNFYADIRTSDNDENAQPETGGHRR